MHQRVLVTGATGFLASHYLLEALDRTNANFICLARTTLRQEATERVWQALASASDHAGEPSTADELQARFGTRVEVLAADLSVARCGLSEEQVAQLRVDEVQHMAAMLRFSPALQKYVDQSIVDATSNMLELAEAAGATTFNYMSTAIVAGNLTGVTYEALHHELDTADTAYELAKRRAEQQVVKFCAAQGLSYRIFRPSIVVGHSATMRGMTDTGLYGLLTICSRLQNEIESKIPGFLSSHPIKLLVKSPHAAMNVLYVDDVIQQMLVIGSAQDSVDQIFHITNETQTPVSMISDVLAEVLDIAVNRVPDLSEFEPLDHLVRKQIGEFEKYFSNTYLFQRTNAMKYLAEEDAARPISAEDVRVLLANYQESFLRTDARASLFESPLDDLEERTLETADGELTYYVGGEGEQPLVIINAYGQSLHFWNELLVLFRQSFRVYVWEIRGTSVVQGGMNEAFTLNDHVEDARQILCAENVRGANLVGWCTGGKLALELAAKEPERVGAIVCMTPSFKGTAGEDLDTKYEQNMEPICRLVARNPNAASTVQKYMGDFFGGAETTSAADDEMGDNVVNVLSMVNRNVRPLLVAPFVAQSSIVNYARQLLQFWSHDISSVMSKVSQPILLLSGENDDIASPELARRVLSRFPNVIGYQVSGGTHYIHKDNSAAVSDMVNAFVSFGSQAVPSDNRLERVI